MSLYGTTNSFGFNLIDFASMVWHSDEYSNWRKLDSILSSLDTDVPFIADIGAANAYVCTYNPAIVAYTDGLILAFRPLHTNTSSCTINVNGLGIKNIQFNAMALSANDIIAGGYVKIVYNGDHFEQLEPKIVRVTVADGAVTPAKMSTGHPSWDASGNDTVTGNEIVGGNLVVSGDVKSGTNQIFFRQASTSFASATITYSVSDPSGGNDGDIWLKYT